MASETGEDMVDSFTRSIRERDVRVVNAVVDKALAMIELHCTGCEVHDKVASLKQTPIELPRSDVSGMCEMSYDYGYNAAIDEALQIMWKIPYDPNCAMFVDEATAAISLLKRGER